jgi:hypothetical protein
MMFQPGGCTKIPVAWIDIIGSKHFQNPRPGLAENQIGQSGPMGSDHDSRPPKGGGLFLQGCLTGIKFNETQGEQLVSDFLPSLDLPGNSATPSDQQPSSRWF